MVKLLLGLDAAPAPHDVADALAVALCHLNTGTGAVADRIRAEPAPSTLRSWRAFRP
jgi:Holliday junction resolvasome RuvABC endonuclease subunit